MGVLTMTRTTVRAKGQVTLPAEVRAMLHVDEGDEIEFIPVEGGVLIHGLTMVPAEQAWFWTDSWQRGEREASEDIEKGRTTTHKSVDDLFDHLDRL